MDLHRQLFLSKSVVTESEIFDGGVLVEDGVIKQVLKRNEADNLVSESAGKIKVCVIGHLATL